jgi:hypothetical protein
MCIESRRMGATSSQQPSILDEGSGLVANAYVPIGAAPRCTDDRCATAMLE